MYCTLSTQQPTYLVKLLHFSDISGIVRSSVAERLCVPKTKLDIAKRAFTVAAPTIWNQLPITIKSSKTRGTIRKMLKHICLKLPFHHKFSAVPCFSDDF